VTNFSIDSYHPKYWYNYPFAHDTVKSYDRKWFFCGHTKLASQCIRRRRASYSKSGIRDAVTTDGRRLGEPQEQPR
jgi:hypothetical protein